MPNSPSVDPGVGHKRPHRKSKRGCQQCKRQRIKCDERKPSCGHCARYQSQCSFLDSTPASLDPDVKIGPSTFPQPIGGRDELLSNTSSIAEEIPTMLSKTLGVTSLEILHFYTIRTSFTLSDRPELQRIWQHEVPRMAFADPFLLHEILAFSALHLARSEPERKAMLYTEASWHHDMGLKLFRTAISNGITPENCDACFTFSAIVAAYAWASSDQSYDLFFSDASSEETSTVEWASLLRGVYTLLKAAGGWMINGLMHPILQDRYVDPELVRAADPEVTANLTALSQLWEKRPENFSSNNVEILNETLGLLKEACGLVALSNTDPKLEIDVVLVVYAWPIKIPEAFFDMVKKQIPEALILLAHYSLLLNKVEKLWYMQGMSRRLLQTIHTKLGKKWERWITWPLQALVLAEFDI
ncbi:Sterol uptake control protein [Lachnellula suecica]|uniref:Sterol uptake control protein n=1 Tax=Lachnellula suecica TaxID=602035 RepID=A0A8T9C4F1_9HELO|nr:Sterol uptake control protein [Lachnellula suecica]